MKLFSITPVAEIQDVIPTITVTNNVGFSLCIEKDEGGREAKVEHAWLNWNIDKLEDPFSFPFLNSYFQSEETAIWVAAIE